MMALLVYVVEIFKSLPAILTALLAIKKLWDEFLTVDERRQAMLDFAEAMNVARTTKDPSKVAAVLTRITGGTST
jgi:hypothetical protein